jgi:hypothetical protein
MTSGARYHLQPIEQDFIFSRYNRFILLSPYPEAESKEKHGVWDPMPELIITSPYVHSRVFSNTFTMGIGQPYARVDLNPMPESTLTLCQSRP